MDISSLSSIVDILSEFSFKDALSLCVIVYQVTGNKLLRSTTLTETEELSELTPDEPPTANSSSSLLSIIRDNAKNRAKALIQKFHSIMKRRSVGKRTDNLLINSVNQANRNTS